MSGPRPVDPDFLPEVPPPPPPPPKREREPFGPEVPPPPPPPTRELDPDEVTETDVRPLRESQLPRRPSRPDMHDVEIIDRGAPIRGSGVVARGVRSGLAMIITGR